MGSVFSLRCEAWSTLPLRLPCMKLEIYAGDTANLVPAQARAYDAQPNPHVDTAGIREVIEDAGPQLGWLKLSAIAVWLPGEREIRRVPGRLSKPVEITGRCRGEGVPSSHRRFHP